MHAGGILRLAALAAWTTLAAAAHAQSVKLSAPLPDGETAWIGNVRLTQDGTRVLFGATQGSPVPGHFSVPIDGSSPPRELVPPDWIESDGGAGRLPLPLVPDGRLAFSDGRTLWAVPPDGSRAPLRLLAPAPERVIATFALAPDGRHVVFTANPSGRFVELYAAPLREDAEPVLLHGSSDVTRIQFTPDGQRVVFQTNNDFHVVPLDGSAAAVRLNGDEFSFGHLRSHVTSDGTRLVYLARHTTFDGYHLYSVPLDGTAPPRALSGPLVAGGSVDPYLWSPTPDGTRIVYVADQETDHFDELYSVPADGTTPPVKLNHPVPRNRDVTRFEIAPDGARVVYVAGRGVAPRMLWSVPIDRSREPFALDGPPPRGGFQFAAGGTRVVYQVERGSAVDLHSSSVLRVDGVALTHGDFPFPSEVFRITPDGLTVVFANRDEIRRAPVDGSRPSERVAARSPGHPELLLFTPDGKTLVFESFDAGTRSTEIFSVPLDGRSAPVRLCAPTRVAQPQGDVSRFRLTPGGRGVVHTVTRYYPPADFEQLAFVRLAGTAPPVELHPHDPDPGTFEITDLELGAGAARVVFRAGDGDAGWSLLSAPADGSAPAVALNDPTTSAGGVGGFRLTGDGEWAVFTSYDGEDESELYSAPVGGGIELELAESPGAWAVGARGRHVVYVADGRLWAAPADLVTPPVLLHGPFPSGGYVGYGDIAVTATLAVYRGNLADPARRELFSAPLDGSAPPRRLDPDGEHLVMSGFEVTPDGAWVVHRAYAAAELAFELFAVPVDGSAAPVRLSGAMVPGGDVAADFRVDVAHARVLFRADRLVDERFELFAAPLDGSAEPVRLSGELVEGGDVLGSRYRSGRALELTLDGTRVVYRADAAQDGVPRLWSVPTDGSAGPTPLGGALAPGRSVYEGFRITPDGAGVVYVADEDAQGVFELFVAPLHGGAGRKLNGPLVAGGDVLARPWSAGELVTLPAFDLTPDARSVVYLADQDVDEVFELYRSDLAGPRVRSAGRP